MARLPEFTWPGLFVLCYQDVNGGESKVTILLKESYETFADRTDLLCAPLWKHKCLRRFATNVWRREIGDVFRFLVTVE